MEISIIIPVYNKIKYIRSLLEMISNQTFADYECILVDDGSTDGCSNVCDEFSQNDSRFKCVHISNSGVSNARNVGLCYASGKYVTFIDADDEISPNYLQNLYDCIIRSGADIVIGGHSNIWDNREEIVPAKNPYETGLYQISDVLSNFAKIQRQSGLYGWCWSKLLSRELIGESRFTEGLTLAEDFDFYLEIYSKVDTIYFDDNPNYLYRQEAENGSVVKDDAAIDYLAQLKINLRYRSFLKNVGAWSGDNKKIVEQLLSNYAYFVMFHSPVEDFEERFAKVNEICQKEKIKFHPTGIFQRLLLNMLRKNKKQQAKNTMIIYRYLRKIGRRNG